MTDEEINEPARAVIPHDDLPAMRSWYRTWRVSWWRANWAAPRRAEFGLLADAKKFAREAAVHEDSKLGGRVVKVQIEERLVSSWTVIHERVPRPGGGAFRDWGGD